MPPEIEIQTIKDRFIEQLKPISIYLFGSFAKGNNREDSDLDFYIVMPDNSGDQIELSQKAYKSLKGLKRRPVDIIVGYESNFNKRARENTIEAIVTREGKILYKRP